MVRVYQEWARKEVVFEMHDCTVYAYEFLLESGIAELGRCEFLGSIFVLCPLKRPKYKPSARPHVTSFFFA